MAVYAFEARTEIEDSGDQKGASAFYFSCRRAEGFWLTIAEAMLRGVPLMVTGWSGNTDFCSRENCFPIDAKQVSVVLNTPEFWEMEHASWADADARHAEQLLTYSYKNRGKTEQKAKCAQMEVMQYLIKPHYISSSYEISCGARFHS
jgi:hypothetical protein